MIMTVSTNIMRFKGYLLQIVKYWLTPYLSRVSYSIPYIGGFIAYFFLGIGSCLGGLSMNDFNNWWITSDSDRSCSLLSRLSISTTSFEVLNDRNPDFSCRMIYTILDKYYLYIQCISYRLCMTTYDRN